MHVWVGKINSTLAFLPLKTFGGGKNQNPYPMPSVLLAQCIQRDAGNKTTIYKEGFCSWDVS